MFVSDTWSVQDYRNSAHNIASHVPRRQFEYEKLIQSMNNNQFQNKMNAMEEESKRAFADRLRAKQIDEYKRRQKIERQRKLTIYDTKGNQSSISVSFYSKILKVEINLQTLYVASKDIIFIFSLKDMQQIMQIKAPNHLLRITLSPNLREQDGSQLPTNQIAYSNDFEDGIVKLVRFSTQSKKSLNQ